MLAAAAMGGAFLASANAHAADLGGYKDVEPPMIDMWGPGWAVRLRALGVVPNEGSSDWRLDHVPLAGAGLSIDSSIVPELDISYFFTRNIAVELILGVTPHDVNGGGPTLAGDQIGSVWLLPPTLLLQYHFDAGRGIKPYVGAGVNYTFFYNESSGTSHLGPLSNFTLSDNWGWALQAGVDIPLGRNWFFNIDVKRIWLDTNAKVDVGGLGRVTADVTIDPWLIGVGVGYKFGAPLPPLR